MNQRQVVIAVVAVGLASAALLSWHQGADRDATTPPAAQTPAAPFAPSSTHVATSAPVTPAPVAPPPQAEAITAAPAVAPEVASAPVDVDTPEPAERKFARGAQPQSDPN